MTPVAVAAMAAAVPDLVVPVVTAPRRRHLLMDRPIRTPNRSLPVVMVSRLARVKAKVRVAVKAAVLAVVKDPDRAAARVLVVRVLGWVLAQAVPDCR